jgi:hypothetical protein
MWAMRSVKVMVLSELIVVIGLICQVVKFRRLEIMMSSGPAARDEIRDLTRRMDELANEYAANDPLGDTGRLALFGDMADLVDRCLAAEQ